MVAVDGGQDAASTMALALSPSTQPPDTAGLAAVLGSLQLPFPLPSLLVSQAAGMQQQQSLHPIPCRQLPLQAPHPLGQALVPLMSQPPGVSPELRGGGRHASIAPASSTGAPDSPGQSSRSDEEEGNAVARQRHMLCHVPHAVDGGGTGQAGALKLGVVLPPAPHSAPAGDGTAQLSSGLGRALIALLVQSQVRQQQEAMEQQAWQQQRLQQHHQKQQQHVEPLLQPAIAAEKGGSSLALLHAGLMAMRATERANGGHGGSSVTNGDAVS